MKAKHVLAIAGVIFITPFPCITLPVAALALLAVRGVIYCRDHKRRIQEGSDELPSQEADDDMQQGHEASLISISPDGSKLFVFEPNTPSPAKAVIIASIINGTAGCNLLLLSQTIGGSILSYILPATSCAVSCIVLSRVIKAHLEDGKHKFRIVGSYNLSDQVTESDAHNTSEMSLGGESAEFQTVSD